MATIKTQDGTNIFYKDWGLRDAQPIVFHHGWPLSGDDWDNQMLYFLEQGYRVIAHDRRGHGRSDQTDTGNEMDTYANDVVELARALDLKNAIHIGHSTGGGEVARYAARAEAGRIAEDDVAARGKAEGRLSAAVGRLIALAEATTDLGEKEKLVSLSQKVANETNFSDSDDFSFTLQARLAELQGRKAEAIDAYREAIRLYPDEIESRLKLARLLAREGQLEEAENEYSMLRILVPKRRDIERELQDLRLRLD